MSKTDLIKVVPSKLELCCACPAATLRSLPYPFEPTEASDRGIDLHERIALLLQVGLEEVDAVCDGLNEVDAQAVRTCYEVGQMLLPTGKHIRFIEEKFDLKFLNMTSGKADLAFYDATSKTVAVVDWKFGKGPVPDPTDNKQLMAYALALKKTLNAQEFTVDHFYLVICQPCGTAAQSYKDAKFPERASRTWETEIKASIVAASAPDPIAIPGIHCKRSYCEAGKHGVCPEFKAYSGEIADAKEQVAVKKAAFAVSGLLPVVVESPNMQFPIIVISEEAIAKAEDFRSQAGGLVVGQDSANAMGLLLNEITKFEAQVEKNRTAVKAPVIELGRLIDEKAKQALIPLKEAKEAAKKRLDEWSREQTAIRDKAVAEANAAIQARVKAEADGQTENLPAVAPVVIPPPVKIAGVKMKPVLEFEVVDFAKMPDLYKMTDEKMLKTAIETGKVTAKDAWVKFAYVEKSQSSGRG